MMYNVCLADRISIRQYKADQAKLERDGSLVLYAWLKIGKYSCPEKKDEVVRYAPGTFSWFEKQDEDNNE